MEIPTFLVGISLLSKIVLMVAMEITHFYIVQFMFEGNLFCITWTMNNLIATKKKKTSWCPGKVKLTHVLFGIIEAYGKFILGMSTNAEIAIRIFA